MTEAVKEKRKKASKKYNKDREKRITYTIAIKPSLLEKLKIKSQEENMYLADLIEHICHIYWKYENS